MKYFVLFLCLLNSIIFNYAQDTVRINIINASSIKGYKGIRNDTIPDDTFMALKSFYIGRTFIQKNDELLPYLYKTSDSSPFSINKNDTLECIDVRRVVNYKLLATEPTIGLVFTAPNGEECWTLKEHSHIYIQDVQERLQKEAAEKVAYEAREKEMIKKYGRRNGRIIAQGKVAIGFTKQMCVDAWGEPKSINKTTNRYGVHEQWVYDGGYLYFDNGKLTTIQN